MKFLIFIIGIINIPLTFGIDSNQFIKIEDRDSLQEMTVECDNDDCSVLIIISHYEKWPYNENGLVKQYKVNSNELLTKKKVPRREYIQGYHIEDHAFIVTRSEGGPLEDAIEYFEDGYYLEGIGTAGLTILFASTIDLIISPIALVVSVAEGPTNDKERLMAVYNNKLSKALNSGKNKISVKEKFYNYYLKVIQELAFDKEEFKTNI